MKRLLPLLLVLLVAIVAQRWWHARRASAAQKIRQCTAHLRAIGTAMNWYAIDNDGFPPTDLHKLVPIYIKELPDCSGHPYKPEVVAKSYTLTCQRGHSDYPLPEGYPYCSTARGLVIQPP